MTSQPPLTRGEATRDSLIRTAHQLFLARGFAATSMRAIAEQAGVAVGGIYNHFATKEDLFEAVMDAVHPYHVVFPQIEALPPGNTADFLHAFLEAVRGSLPTARRDLLPLIFIDVVEFQGRHVQRLAQRIAPASLRLVEQFASRAGELRHPAPVVFRAFMALLAGYLITEMIMRHTPFVDDRHDWFGGLADIFMRGALRTEGTP